MGKKKKSKKNVGGENNSSVVDASANVDSVVDASANVDESGNGTMAQTPPVEPINTPMPMPLPPFVSVCTPTFNRRPFIPYMIKCFQHQDYPRDRMEWIIIDDGSDKIGDLVAHLPYVKYFAVDKQLMLGAKRNMLHDKSCGDIIVYMDDDDYYPPDRVSHAVSQLLAHPTALCAGSSIMHIYFKHVQQIYRFGPYGPNHATAGTMAFKRALLNGGQHRYDDNAALAEEKLFLKNYTVPFVQLDTMKTILVFSHDHNTFDKKRLLENAHPKYVQLSPLKVTDFIKDAAMCYFYVDEINNLLRSYEPGRPNMKPDVLKQMVSIEKSRRVALAKHQQSGGIEGTITFKNGNEPSQTLTMPQVVEILQKQHVKIIELTNLVQGKDAEIQMLLKQIRI